MNRTQGMALLGKYVHGSKTHPLASPQGDLEGWGYSYLDSGHPEDQALAEIAVESAELCFQQVQEGFFSAPQRLGFFKLLIEMFESQSENLSLLVSQEIGKPLSLARIELSRCLKTLQLSARLINELKPGGLSGPVQTRLRGPLLAITPFNFPINLSLHKIAPALALGCPVVWKPSPKASLCAASVFDIFKNAGLPEGFLNLVFCDNPTTLKIAQNSKIKTVSFTGSGPIGWSLKSKLQKPMTLELGGAAPVFVSAQINEIHFEAVVERILKGAFSNAGQSCISIQSVFCQSSVYEKLKKLLIEKTRTFPWGHPRNTQTLCGPVIDSEAQVRIQSLLHEIENKGWVKNICRSENFFSTAPELPPNATLRMKDPLTRPQLTPDSNCFIAPQIFEVSTDFDLNSFSFLKEEVFGPVFFLIETKDDLKNWIPKVNEWPSRLQTAVFTENTDEISMAKNSLDFGGIVINESSSQRDDALPYGGEGQAGLGREGPEWTARDLLSYPQAVLEYFY